MKIGDFTVGKDNNFNLIRMFAAFAVLVSHSYFLLIASEDRTSLGRSNRAGSNPSCIRRSREALIKSRPARQGSAG
jgi:hypothetical protein